MDKKDFIIRLSVEFPDSPLPGEEVADLAEVLGDEEVLDLSYFVGKKWTALTTDIVDAAPDAVCWFNPESFVYYLPGIIKISIEESDSGGLSRSGTIVSNIISLLYPPKSDSSNRFRLQRWGLLTRKQIDLVIEWITWLHSQKLIAEDSKFIRRIIRYLATGNHYCKAKPNED